MNIKILHVWLRGEQCGQLERLRNGKMRFRFSPDFVATYGTGTPSLSVSILNTLKRVEGTVLDRFLENLLPEDPLRAQLEREHHLNPRDTFGLLALIGLDCAGALQFTQREDSPLTGYYRSLTNRELDKLVADTPSLDTPDDLPLTASLGGVQPKLLLHEEQGLQSWPVGGAASNRILKPDPHIAPPIPYLIWLEQWALTVAQAAGVSSAQAAVRRFDTRDALVVERFDRKNDARVHQEDFAQVLGLAVSQKYEPAGGSVGRLREVAGLVQGFAQPQFLADLLRQVTFNAIIGNGDAHSKNYSIMLNATGQVTLSPLYDVAPVFLVNSRFHSLGHNLDGQSSLRSVRPHHLVNEATSWGLNKELAQRTVTEVATNPIGALNAVAQPVLGANMAAEASDWNALFTKVAVDAAARAQRFRTDSS